MILLLFLCCHTLDQARVDDKRIHIIREIMCGLGFPGLALARAGLYELMTYSVSLRRHENGGQPRSRPFVG